LKFEKLKKDLLRGACYRSRDPTPWLRGGVGGSRDRHPPACREDSSAVSWKNWSSSREGGKSGVQEGGKHTDRSSCLASPNASPSPSYSVHIRTSFISFFF